MAELEKFAEKHLAGGVSSSIRKYKNLGYSIYFKEGKGVKIWDIEGKEYYDLDNSHGATILGHYHPKLRAAVGKALDAGVLCAHETEYQGKLAKKLLDMVPAIDVCRFAVLEWKRLCILFVCHVRLPERKRLSNLKVIFIVILIM